MPRKTRRRKARPRPEFTVPQILAWADAYRRRKGEWPRIGSGPVKEGPAGETWRNVDTALRLGLRGLPGGSSLPRLLEEHRQARNPANLPRLTVSQVLGWADSHKRRSGSWPTSESGLIPDANGETWRGIDEDLRLGLRGLPGGTSLSQLLATERGVRNLQRLPRLTPRQILTWADAHHKRTGSWPTSKSGPVVDAPGETWKGVNSALRLGRRGLPGGSSLARLLAAKRGVPNPKQRPRLTLKQIRAWARSYRRRTGRWPTRFSGPVAEAPGETWSGLYAALIAGCRGLPAGLTLARLLEGPDGTGPKAPRPPLTEKQILAWADAHHRRTGSWPDSRSGPIPEAEGETWRAVDHALHKNQRGLDSGLTLARLLREHRGVRYRQHLPPLTEKQILAWADAHHQRTGTWPTFRSGPIPGADGETWRGVDTALGLGGRGLRGGTSLARLLAEGRGVRNRTSLPPLQPDQIVSWARAHRKRTGSWPTTESGPVAEAPGETWHGVDLALRGGYRGLPGGTSLARLLARRLGVRNRASLPTLTPEQIRRWAERHYRRTGAWPTRDSGSVLDAPEETWRGLDLALRGGYRGLPRGSSLARLLDERREPSGRPAAGKRAVGPR